MDVKEELLAWADQFENDHYIFDVYGKTVTADVPKEIVEKLIEIAILLVDRVVAAQGSLSTAEYEKLEQQTRKEYPDESDWLIHVMLNAYNDERLFGRYIDIEPMIGELELRGCYMGTAAYIFMIKPEIILLIYAVIRHVDDIVDNYKSLVYSFLIGVITKGWSEGGGWFKTEDGNWEYRSDG